VAGCSAWRARLSGCLVADPEVPPEVINEITEALNPTDSNNHQYNDATGTLSSFSTAGVIDQTGRSSR
jgi:hypothetical protein